MNRHCNDDRADGGQTASRAAGEAADGTPPPGPANPQKARRGLDRILHAGLISIAGLRAGWGETAFRQEALGAVVLLPMAFWVGRGWMEVALLSASVMLVLIVELLNSGIEAAIDRVGPEWHALSKKAKDLGSAAVLLSLLLCGAIWAAALWQRFGTTP
ncbi:diacylglycerol kinase [Variovorax sp. PvP013]|jgi:diacylglycerol kinase (ATP)|uniref:diacylglycerol kinase n=1 Tax=Variovorax sp. PvP013 TaxID=3156435 RepID=UPI003D24B492